MSFKVDEQFHRTFKIAAAMFGLSMVDLLKESFEAWNRTKNG